MTPPDDGGPALQPCPFCEGPTADNESDAMQAWNTRAKLDAVEALAKMWERRMAYCSAGMAQLNPDSAEWKTGRLVYDEAMQMIRELRDALK